MENKELKYPAEVRAICFEIEDRVIELCKKFGTQDISPASLPAFWIGVQGDIDSALIKVKKKQLFTKTELLEFAKLSVRLERKRIMEKIKKYERPKKD